MDSAFVISWLAPLPGRGEKGLELVVDLEKYWSDQAVRGCCTAPDVFLLPNGPGTVTVKGERRVLEKLATREDLRSLLANGRLLFRNWYHGFVKTDDRLETLCAAGDPVAQKQPSL